ncbi:VOC family protein [Microbacteriaceae bacterium VKM Ac-2855]|nr:VOC family protein [Microbacteriaceae bacterium VKM Ac-2855]
MAAPVPYLHFPGVASAALGDYRDIFGGELTLHTFAQFQRDDGDPDFIAHGELRGPVDLYAADAVGGETATRMEGVLLALLGAADAATSREWFEALAAGGTVIDALQQRPWGDFDGQVRDRYGISWLIGFQAES